ncbi:MAG TPA: metallophosphoesterase [Thermoguttaceae bacterium]|nr:metallophosphoesterase [Thermoguttaceae bacterium]
MTRIHGLRLALLICLIFMARTTWAADANPISSDSWSMIILPDTQMYSRYYPSIYNAQTQWIADHKTSHNIQVVLHEGDITDRNNVTEFNVAKTAMNTLDSACIPYSMATGNHEYGTSGSSNSRNTLFNDPAYFGPGSSYANQSNITFYETDRTDNSYMTFSAGGKDWLVFSTEFGPRNDVVSWMDSVAAAHPGYNFILNTHAYLYYDDTRLNWSAHGSSQYWNPHGYGIAGQPGGVNDGQELWDKLVKKYDTWRFVFSGHVLNDGAGRLASEGDNGNYVHQILANYQSRLSGGEGYLRILEFMNDGLTVKVSSYSPYLGTYLNTWEQSFTVRLGQGPRAIHGASATNIDVPVTTTDAGSVWTVAQSGPSTVAVTSPPNMGDILLSFGGVAATRPQGVLLATVRQNLRENRYYGNVEVSHMNYFGGADDPNSLQLCTGTVNLPYEFNVNVAAGFFPFGDGWVGGHVDASGDLLEHNGVNIANISHTGIGRYRVAIDGVDSRDDGMLFAVSASNGYNYISTAARASGTGWDVAIRDVQATDPSVTKDGKWSFIYVDYDIIDLTGGRIAADGTMIDGAGQYSVSHEGAGVYRIAISGYTPTDGALFLTVDSPETVNGTVIPADNVISYEADNNSFLVNTRDRNGSLAVLEDTGFAFLFLPFDNHLLPTELNVRIPPAPPPPVILPGMPGDTNFDNYVDQIDAAALASHWGNTNATWEMGDFNLDGVIGPKDASILAANWHPAPPNETQPVPEPSTLYMLVLAAVCVLESRRRTSSRR